MERRREQRIAIILPVRLWGIDRNGEEFTQIARTIQISKRGGILEGVDRFKGPGEVFLLQYRERRARFQVVWVGHHGTNKEGQVGIRCLDSEKFSWGVVALKLPKIVFSGEDDAKKADDQRRRYMRYGCNGSATIRVDMSVSAVISDISLGGCFVTTNAPFPVGTPVGLLLTVNNTSVRVKGMVQATDENGMGIAFSAITAEEGLYLQKIVNEVASNLSRPERLLWQPKPSAVVYC
jgi:Tfp pilus assembly protein PilZ